MSRNSGARGQIIIPQKAYSKLSKALIEKHAQMQKSDYEAFNLFLEKILLKYKGKRNLNWQEIVTNEAYVHYLHNPHSHINKPDPFQSCSVYDLSFASIDFKDTSQKPKLLKQKKFKVSENVHSFCFDENSISINKADSTLNIYISYNNHSVEEAQKNPFFRFALQELHKIQWTANTGGEVYMTQEEDENMGCHSSSHTIYKFSPTTR